MSSTDDIEQSYRDAAADIAAQEQKALSEGGPTTAPNEGALMRVVFWTLCAELRGLRADLRGVRDELSNLPAAIADKVADEVAIVLADGGPLT